jgi:DNA-binding MarR family transcriptional regulator
MAEPRGRADVAVFAQIGAIERLATRRLERALPAGLSATGLELLNRLALAAEPSSPQTLAGALLLSKPAITHSLQRLEAMGVVTMTADPADGRRKHVALTGAGAALHREALAAVRPPIEAVRAAFGAHEFEEALPLLQRLAAWLAANP